MCNDKKNLFSSLVSAAKAAGENAYAPYSQFKVGAALVSETGRVFSGGNAETANHKGTCAEAGAIAAMVTAGDRSIREIVIVGTGDAKCPPCGDCRQRIREFSDAATRIHAIDSRGTVLASYTIDQLLPDSFGPDNLKAALK